MGKAWGLLALSGLVLAVLAVLTFQAGLIRPPGGEGKSAEAARPFTLVDQTGRTVTDKDFLGKPMAVFFGFTYCPEVCPTTLTDLTRWMKALGPDADRLNVVYVSVDPERDTPKQMALYLTSFDPRIRGLTGTPEQIAKITSEYRVYYKKVPLEGGGYTMDHSAAIFLMDRNGQLKGAISYQMPGDQALAQLRALVR